MRSIVLGVSLLALAGCGGEEPQKAKAPPPPATIPTGQWATQLHVTSYRKMDEGSPGYTLEQGQRIEAGACVGEGDAAAPPPELFVGEGFTCNWMDNAHMRDGRINAYMTCRRPGVAGDISISVDGQFTAEGMEGLVTYTTALVGDGDFQASARLSGRRSGACEGGGTGGAGNSTNTAG